MRHWIRRLSGRPMMRAAMVIAAAFIHPAPTAAQGLPTGVPSIGVAIAMGSEYGGRYADRSVKGLHFSVVAPTWYSRHYAIVTGATADLLYSDTDICVLDYPASPDGCRPTFPNVTALTIGWLGALGESGATVHLATGYFTARHKATGGALARLEYGPRLGHLGLLAYAQYESMPKFRGDTVALLLLGFGLRLH